MGNKINLGLKIKKIKKNKKNVSNESIFQNKDTTISTADSLDLEGNQNEMKGKYSSFSQKNYSKINKLPSQMKVVKEIGAGTFSKVYLLKDIKSNKQYALKTISKSKIIEKKNIESLKNEKIILSMLSHPFLTDFYSSFQDDENIYFLMDYIEGEELYYVLKRHKKFSESVAQFYLAEIFTIIEYLHKQNIIYRDLKPENIIIDKEGHIKLIDFGTSKILNKKTLFRTHSFKGTFEYMAPEVLNQNASYSFQFDWWSFGILMYKMLTGKLPFDKKETIDLLYSIKYEDKSFDNDNNLKFLSHDAKDLIKQLLNKDVNNRITSDKIIGHPWFKNVNFSYIENKKNKPPLKPKIVQNYKQVENLNFKFELYGTKNNMTIYNNSTIDDIFKDF